MSREIVSLFEKQANEIFIISGDASYTYDDIYQLSLAHHETQKHNSIIYNDHSDPIDFITLLFYTLIHSKVHIALDSNLPEKTKELLIEEVEKEPFNDHDDLVIFTSGSSGKPKGVIHSLESIILSSKSTISHYSIDHSDAWGLSLPLFHIGGMMIVFRMFFTGAKVVLAKNNDLSTFFHPEITFLSLVHTQLLRLVESIEQGKFKRPNFKGIILGGAKTSESLLERAIQLDLSLSNSYGSSELCAQAIATPLTQDLNILRTVGSVMPYRQISINEGHLQFERTADNQILFHRYLGDGPKNIKIFQTTDLARMSEYGIEILGRSDHIFQSGGENINPQEIEMALNQNKEIKDSLVCSFSHDQFDLAPMAFIEVNQPLDQQTLRDHLKHTLSTYKVPKYFIQDKTLSYLKKGIKKSRALASNFTMKQNSYHFSFYGNAKNPALVMIHGFMGQSSDFLNIVNHMMQNYFICLIDLPGHGQNSHKTFKSWDIFLADLKSQIPFEKYNLFGYSLGGRVAIGLSYIDDRINKIIIESSNLGIYDHEKEKRREFDQTLFDGIQTQADLDSFLEHWYSMEIFKGITNTPKKSIHSLNGWKQCLNFLSVAEQPNYWDSLRALKPLHYIYGSDDLKYARFALRLGLVGHKIYKIEGASHNVHHMKEDEFLKSFKRALTL
ncbi:alpha/beta fold hydrolase [Halobacteriovorax sp. GB3]|uniref:alpha/beta fold hydrolase n=1 Tax=Halobacteriovorax sp. GB3 TaxID=2719615 RepID=UPI00236013B7|nr:alpha/beta fold hydrolase [Halobacteriovorax sp. GB3]MDD0852833.1 alpha/beta fold hydrolase [Halobacteriovorax sp. GB3]